jgi:hypothetical protein
MRPNRVIVSLLFAALALVPAGTAPASHGPTRSGTDACNGTDAFDINNLVTAEIVDAIAAQNPGARRADGTIDRTQITHALLKSSGHALLQVREKAGFPLSRVTFEFSGTNSGWTGHSANHPGYLTAIDAQENPAADADSDLVLGKTFTFFIPTDVVGDGNFVARMRGFRADGAEAGRICLDAVVANGQSWLDAGKANTDPAYEPSENPGSDHGFVPQPVVYFPAGEPTAAQQAGYGLKDARIEFAEQLQAATIARERDLPTPTGLTGTPSSTGGSLATGTYFYKVTALNATGETVPSGEISVPVTGPTGSVALSWNAVPGATGYRVYRGTASGGQNVFYTSGATSFTDTGAAGTAGSPPATGTAKIWVDESSRLSADAFSRPHFLAGGRMDGTGLEGRGNEKVWGPGYRFPFGALAGESLPAERLRISSVDTAGKRFCGVYTFAAGDNGSFGVSRPAACS